MQDKNQELMATPTSYTKKCKKKNSKKENVLK